jgi:hypothetical protein
MSALHPRPELEAALLRRSVGALSETHCRCHACRRTPLIGERVAVYDDGRTLCALCRGRRREAPAATPLVRAGAFGEGLHLRPAA